jgi:hypothetical protein
MAIRDDGYEVHFVWDGNKYHTKYKHRDLWEEVNGTIPKGMIVHHKDGDPRNTVIENLELLTRSEHAKIHGQFKKLNEASKGKTLEEILGKEKADASKAKRSISSSGGKTTNPEQRKKISMALKGRPKSDAHRRKLSEVQKGRPLTDAEWEEVKRRREAKKCS